MDEQQQIPPEEYLEIAEKVRTGEYFREARGMYDTMINDPMSERYLYILITTIAMAILVVSIYAAQQLYPLERSVPFIFNTNNIVDDLPRMKSLVAFKGEDPSEALLRFLVKNYVTTRESYDIETFDRNTSGIKQQSSPQVFGEFQNFINPANPESPIVQYQRHSRRVITILATKRLEDQDYGMEVYYDVTIENRTEVKKSRWQADIAFSYSGVELDDEGEKVKPINFVVTKYLSKRLQDLR
jgi:type IV secretory pathway component VirB8